MGLMDGIFGAGTAGLRTAAAQRLMEDAQINAPKEEYIRAMQGQANMISNTTSNNINTAIGNGYAAAQAQQAMRAAPDTDPNDDPAYTPALSVIKGMWQVKWGDAWVQATALRKEGEFWDLVRERLWNADLLERTDGRSYWYRIKE